jgi:hypothetical protein
MIKKFKILTVTILTIFSLSVCSQKYKAGVVAFYNIENLFDTLKTPGIFDEEFTPAGSKKWGGDRYWKKIDNNAKVISLIGSKDNVPGPAIVGLSEIENRGVIEDLINSPHLKPLDYGIVHYDSPDKRGVDVGLIYQKKYFTVTGSRSAALLIYDKDTKQRIYTRDQLVVSGLFDGEPMHFIVNHWPSRRGGEKASAYLRNAAADLSRSIIDSIKAVDPNAKVILMGDLNDDPNNNSLVKHLRANGDIHRLKKDEVFNAMGPLFKKGIGSLAYRDSWNLFDQIVITQPLLGNDYSSYKFRHARVFNDPMLTQKEGRFQGYPLRTFVGDTFTAGYSDHFPVYILLVKEDK